MNNVVHHPSFGVGMARHEIRQMRQSKLTCFIHRKAESLGIPYGLTIYINARAQRRFSKGTSIAACMGRATLELMKLAEANGETA